jgi:hypothetical protein
MLFFATIVQLKYILLASLKVALAGKWDWKGMLFNITLAAILVVYAVAEWGCIPLVYYYMF